MKDMITKSFSEVFDLSLGRTPSRGNNLYWNGIHPWVSIADMSNVKYISQTKEKITDKALSDTHIPIVKKGTVIMSFKLTIGKVCITDCDIYTNEAIMAFTPKPQYKILPEFLFYYLMYYKWDKSNEVVLGCTLNKKSISQSLLSYPSSLAEQLRIIEILDAEFAKIDALRANVTKSLQAAKDLFQSALKQEFNTHKWELSSIGTECKTGAGGTPNKMYKEYYENGNIPWLRSGEVCTRNIYATEKFITQAGMENSSAKWFPSNTVVVAMYGATAGQVGILRIPSTTNQAICGIFPNEKYLPDFLYYVLLSQKDTLVAQATGNAQANISQIKIKNITIPIISLAEQTRIVSRLDQLNERCKTLQENYDRTITLCEDLKQALLRKAFNGEL